MKANFIYRVIFFIFISTTLVFSASVIKAESTESISDDVALLGNVRTDVVSYAEGGSDWTIYFRPGIRFGTEDRVISYYDLLVPLYFTDKSVLFFNPRYSFDDRDGYEWNFGLGYRHLLFDDKVILGGNVFYDMRRSYTGKKYDQIGVGAEVLTEWVNGRVNGYISLSDPNTIASWKDWYFTNTGLAFSQGKEVPMSGVDYELGAKIPYISDYVETWVYAGGYNFSGSHSKNMNGFMARLEVIPTDFLKLNYEMRHDNVRDTEHYGEVSVEIPFSIDNLVSGKNPFEGIGSRFGGSRTMEERLYSQVRRDVDIKLGESDYGRPTCMCSCQLGDTEYCDMVYVNNSSTTGIEDGSLENPYVTIGAAFSDPNVPACKVFVFKGSGPYNENLTLPDGICLWGEGYDPYGMGFSGYSVVSGLQDGGWFNGSVYLGNNVSLMGFNLQNRSDSPNNPVVAGWGISNAIVSHNRIINNGNGLFLWNCSNITFSDNSISLRNQPTLSTNSYGIVAYGSNSNIDIIKNSISSYFTPPSGAWADAGGIMFLWGSPLADNINIVGNNINLYRNKIGVPSTSGGHGTYGIYMEADTVRNVLISGNNVKIANGADNYLLILSNVEDTVVSDNSFTISRGATEPLPRGSDIGFLIGEGGASNLLLNGNTFNINSTLYASGVLVESWGNPIGTVDMVLSNNIFIIHGSGDNYGMSFKEGTYNTSVFGNIISGNVGTGFYFDAGITGGVIDLGGGALGSIGGNNTGYTNSAVHNDSGMTIDAQNNTWNPTPPIRTGADPVNF